MITNSTQKWLPSSSQSKNVRFPSSKRAHPSACVRVKPPATNLIKTEEVFLLQYYHMIHFNCLLLLKKLHSLLSKLYEHMQIAPPPPPPHRKFFLLPLILSNVPLLCFGFSLAKFQDSLSTPPARVKCLTPADGTNRLSLTSVTNYQSKLHNIIAVWRLHLHHSGSLKSHNIHTVLMQMPCGHVAMNDASGARQSGHEWISLGTDVLNSEYTTLPRTGISHMAKVNHAFLQYFVFNVSARGNNVMRTNKDRCIYW
jgi:hypothetical protein